MSTRAGDGYALAQQQGLIGEWLVASSGRRPQRTPPRQIEHHDYDGDGDFDQDGNDRCTACKLGRDQGRGKQAHAPVEPVPVEVSPEVQALSARILGEHEGSRE